ncbi:MAG: hypothetical protein OHK003_28770 [Anaerolineales bacterium]
MFEAEFQKHLEFTEADLLANRRGEYSPRQKAEQEAYKKSSTRILIIWAIGYALVAALISFIAYVEGSGQSYNILETNFSIPVKDVKTIYGILFIWVMSLVVLFVPSLNFFAAWSGAPSVQKTEGSVTLLKVEKNKTGKNIHGRLEDEKYQVYEMRINDFGFVIPEPIVDLIKEGDVYAVYHPKGGKAILSMEMLSKGKR